MENVWPSLMVRCWNSVETIHHCSFCHSTVEVVYTECIDDNRLPCMVQVWGYIESLPVRKGRGNLCTAI